MTQDPAEKNEYVIKLSGKASISQDLKIGKNYTIKAEGTITSKTESDNDDGTHTFYSKFQPIIIEITAEGEKAIRAKDIRRQSQKLRGILWRQWGEKNEEIEFENFYNKRMAEILSAVVEGLI